MDHSEYDLSEKSQNDISTSQRPRVVRRDPDRTFERYMVDSFKDKAINSKQVPFESIDLSLYSPSANLLGFKTSEERLRFWIEAIQRRYVDGLKDKYTITWEELDCISDPSKAEKIILTICSKTNKKLFALNIFITTGRLQIRGSKYKDWAKSEFPLIMQIINKLNNSEEITSGDCEYDLFPNDDEIKTHSNSDDDDENYSSSDSENESENDNSDRSNQLQTLTNSLSNLEVDFIQSKAKVEQQLHELQSSFEKIMFLQDKVTTIENKCKGYQSAFDDKLYHNTSTIDSTNKRIDELSIQVKTLQDQRQQLQTKQTQMNKEIHNLKKENTDLRQQLFVLREISQKHENALEHDDKNVDDKISKTTTPSPNPSEQPSTHSLSNPCQSPKSQQSPSQTENTFNTCQSQKSQQSPSQIENTFNTSHKRNRPTTKSTSTDQKIVIIDSNGKYLDTNLLGQNTSLITAYTLQQVKETTEKQLPNTSPESIILHCGTNDLEKFSTDTVINTTKQIITSLKTKYPSTKIIYSSLLPRNDHFNHNAILINKEMEHFSTTNNVKYIDNSHISQPFQFYDYKHLNRCGIKFLGKNIKSALFGTATKQLKARRQNQHSNMTNHVVRPNYHFTAVPYKPTYASVTSRSMPRGPQHQVRSSTGLPGTLKTLIEQLQLFI